MCRDRLTDYGHDYGMEVGMNWLFRMVKVEWRESVTSSNWVKDMPIFKKKNKDEYNIYRGISLIYYCRKLYEKILKRKIAMRMG